MLGIVFRVGDIGGDRVGARFVFMRFLVCWGNLDNKYVWWVGVVKRVLIGKGGEREGDWRKFFFWKGDIGVEIWIKGRKLYRYLGKGYLG